VLLAAGAPVKNSLFLQPASAAGMRRHGSSAKPRPSPGEANEHGTR